MWIHKRFLKGWLSLTEAKFAIHGEKDRDAAPWALSFVPSRTQFYSAHLFQFFVNLFAMAVQPSAELKFLLNREEVPETIQSTLFEAGVRTIKQFGALVKDTDELRELAKDSFNLDGKDLKSKVQLSCLVCAFTAAKARANETDKLDAENEVRSLPKTIPGNDFMAMRKAFQAKFWELDDTRTPGRSYLEKKMEGLEKSDLRAEKLSEVVNLREDDNRELRPVWDLNGSMKAMKAQSTVALPQDPEQLRMRISLMSTAWVFTAFQQTDNRALQNLTPFVFNEYLDYLLGEHVWGLTAKGSDGVHFGGPSWALLLSYEHEIRTHAYSLVTSKGMPLVDAMKAAWKDEIVKGRYFITPLALQSNKRQHDATSLPQGPWPKVQKTGPSSKKGKNSKGKGKGKGGKGKGGGEGCARTTPDGKQICYRFNAGSTCSNTPCTFEHVCGVCFKKNVPMGKCNHAN